MINRIFVPAKRPDVDLNELGYLIMHFVWEKETMSLETINKMEKAMVGWNDYAEWTEDADIKLALQTYAKYYQMGEEGKLDARKRLFKEKKIDWRKVCKMPGAITADDIKNSNRMYARYKREHEDTEN